jgi:AraC-like DNA-binding protein
LKVEQSKIWRNKSLPGVELLSASYNTFAFSKHWHDELAIGNIEEGAEGLLYKGESLLVPKHHIVAINPSEVHTGFSGAPNGWRYRMFYFNLPTLLAEFNSGDLAISPIIENPVINDRSLYVDLLQLHHSLEQSSFELTKESLLTTVLDTLFSRHGSIKNIERKHKNETKSAYLVRDMLQDNWHENPSLSALESLTGQSKFQIIRNFTKQFGITPHQFLLLIKAQKAKHLLAQGISCVETSLACGFYDQSHFSRNFKRAFGISPSRYLYA